MAGFPTHQADLNVSQVAEPGIEAASLAWGRFNTAPADQRDSAAALAKPQARLLMEWLRTMFARGSKL